MVGGYIMIDCTGLDLIKGSTEQTISGLYKRVQDAMKTGKPICACNCNWDGAYASPISCLAIQLTADTIVATANTLQIWITNTDTVTIVNLVGE